MRSRPVAPGSTHDDEASTDDRWIEPHLDERGARGVRGRQGSRTHPRAALRHGRLRGRARLREPRGPARDLPPRRPPGPPVPVRRALPHGDPVLQGGDPRRDPRDDHPQRPQVLLHPAARLPRRRPDGPVPAGLSRRGLGRGLAVGRLPRRRGQAERHPRQGLLVAAHQPGLPDPGRQGHGPVPQLRAGQDRGRQGRLRGGHPARPARHGLRGHGREPVRRQGRPDRHARLHELDPGRHQPPERDRDRARPRLRGRRARHRARRALPGRRDLPAGHRRRAHAAARDRRPARRRGAPRSRHPRDPERLRGRAARPRGALRPLAGRGARSGTGPVSRIQIYDTTLRDGMQGEGMSLSAEEKVRVAHLLDELGIPLIEAGFPASNPKEEELFERLAAERFSADVCAFGMTRRRDVRAEDDPALRLLASCFAPVCTLVGKTWSLHLEKVVRVDPEENLRMIADSVAFLVGEGKRVIYDAEHFFDGFRADPAYALRCLGAAAEAGAECVTLCDTNGSSVPAQVTEATARVVADLGDSVSVGIHTHDDAGCGVANSLVAIEAGARLVQGTLNGYGERCGNANLVTIIPTLELKMGYECIGPDRLRRLTEVAHLVDELCNVTPNPNQPYVGANAFAHKGGMHVAGVNRDARTFEHIDPVDVGADRRVLVSELSGKGTVSARADVDDATAARVYERVKELEHRGYQFEAADGSFDLLFRKETGDYEPLFRLEAWRAIVEKRADGRVETEATIKIWVDGERYVRTAEGNGPVHALDKALREAIGERYPHLRDIQLVNFKVRILDERKGTAAITRVLLDASDGTDSWGAIGVSENIIEASWEALVDSLEAGMLPARIARGAATS